MLHIIDSHAALFHSWQVVRYEQEQEAYMLLLTAVLRDDSRLGIRDYLFADGTRKYSYQWMEANGDLRVRWDNAPHWPDVSTAPHHVHLAGKEVPEPSILTNLEDLLEFVKDWLGTIGDPANL